MSIISCICGVFFKTNSWPFVTHQCAIKYLLVELRKLTKNTKKTMRLITFMISCDENICFEENVRRLSNSCNQCLKQHLSLFPTISQRKCWLTYQTLDLKGRPISLKESWYRKLFHGPTRESHDAVFNKWRVQIVRLVVGKWNLNAVMDVRV